MCFFIRNALFLCLFVVGLGKVVAQASGVAVGKMMGGGDERGREGSPKFYIYNSRSTASAAGQ